MTAPKRNRTGKQPAPAVAKPWYKRTITWAATAVVAPTLATHLTTAITSGTHKAIGSAGKSTASAKASSPSAPLLTAKATPDLSDSDLTWAALDPIGASAKEVSQGVQRARDSAQDGQIDGYSEFMTSLGAVKGTRMAIDLKMSTKTSQQVRLDRIRVAKKCSDPASGTLLYNPPAGPPERPGVIGFDLDQDVPIAQEVRNQGGEFPVFTGKDFFADHIQYFKQNDGYVYRVLIHAEQHYCEFRLLLDVSGDDTSQVITVDDHGKPFRVTGLYTTKGATGDPRMAFSAYRKVFATGSAARTAPTCSTRRIQRPSTRDVILPSGVGRAYARTSVARPENGVIYD